MKEKKAEFKEIKPKLSLTRREMSTKFTGFSKQREGASRKLPIGEFDKIGPPVKFRLNTYADILSFLASFGLISIFDHFNGELIYSSKTYLRVKQVEKVLCCIAVIILRFNLNPVLFLVLSFFILSRGSDKINLNIQLVEEGGKCKKEEGRKGDDGFGSFQVRFRFVFGFHQRLKRERKGSHWQEEKPKGAVGS